MGLTNIDFFFVGDTGRVLQVTLQDDGTAIDITGATVQLLYRVSGGSITTKTMSITVPASGLVEYTFLAPDLTEEGVFQYQVRLTDSGGAISTFDAQGDEIRVVQKFS